MSFWVGVENFDAACEKSRTASSSGCSSSNPSGSGTRSSSSRLECALLIPPFAAAAWCSLSRGGSGLLCRSSPHCVREGGGGCARKESPARKWGAPPPIAPPERDRSGLLRESSAYSAGAQLERACLPAGFGSLASRRSSIRVPPSERRSSALRLYSALSEKNFDTSRRALSNSVAPENRNPCLLTA